MPNNRVLLVRLLKLFTGIMVIVSIMVLLDFSIDFRPPGIQSSYRFNIEGITEDRPKWLKQDNLTILLIKRSDTIIQALHQQKDLQDPASSDSNQPEFARNALRSSIPGYFVSYANGTDLGCIVELKSGAILAEACGNAQYDFAGRAIIGKNSFQNLPIPDYNFIDNFNTLIIRP